MYFSSFEQLNYIILNSTSNKINLSRHLNCITKKEEFKNNLVFFYNVLAKLIGFKITPYLLYEINVESEEKMDKGILAVAKGEIRNSDFYSFDITFSKKAFNMTEEEIYKSYVSGFYSSYNVFHPFVHEMGHIIDYYARTSLTNRENLLTLFKSKNKINFSRAQTQDMIIHNNYHSIQSTNNETLLTSNYNDPLGAKKICFF